MIMKAAQWQFDKDEKRAEAAYKSLQRHHRRMGTRCPPPPKKLASAERPQPARPGEDEIKTAQACAAVAHLGEVLCHGVPPPPTPEEVQKDGEAKAKAAAAARLKTEAEAREKDPDGVLGLAAATTAAVEGAPDPSKGAAAAAVAAQSPEEASKAAALAAEIAAFEAEADGALQTFLAKQPAKPPPKAAAPAEESALVEKVAPKPGSIAYMALKAREEAEAAAAAMEKAAEDAAHGDGDDEEDAESELDNASMATVLSAATASRVEAAEKAWGEVPLPAWAKGTGGRFGRMMVGLQRLELRRCGLDGAAASALGRGLEHPACPLSALWLDGNPLGGGSGLTESLSVNRSLTFVGIRGCGFSKNVRRDWASAVLGAGGKLGAIDCDAFTVVPRPLMDPFYPHGAGGGAPGCIVTGGAGAAAAGPGNTTVKADRKGKASTGASAAATASVGGVVLHGKALAQANAAVAAAAEANRPTFAAHLYVRSSDVAPSDAVLLGACLSRNRYVTSVDLSGSSFDSEAAAVLLDGLEVRERLPPPERCRPCDERYDDPTDDHHHDEDDEDGDGGSGDGGDGGLGSDDDASTLGPPRLKATAPMSPPPPPGVRRALSLATSARAVSSALVAVSSSSSSSSSPARSLSPARPDGGPRFPKPMPPPPAPFGALLSLGLSGVPLGAAGAWVLAEGLNALRHLRHLSAARCGLTDKGKRMDGAAALVAALDDELPPPPEVQAPAFGRRSSLDESLSPVAAAAAAAQVAAGSMGSLLGAFASPSPSSAPANGWRDNVATAAASEGDEGDGEGVGPKVGRSGVFDRVAVLPGFSGLKVAPPLRFVDLSDNGLSATLVWRAVVTMRRRTRHLHWLDLSGNCAFDAAPPPLAVAPGAWAIHNRPPFALGLSLPMRHAVLFAGCQVDWVVECRQPERPGSRERGGGGGDSDGLPPGALDMPGLEAVARDHGAPPSFSPTGKEAVAAMVAQIERERPGLARDSKDTLREAAWRGQRLKEIDADIAAAEKRRAKVLERHRAAERAEKAKAAAEAAAEAARAERLAREEAEALAAAEAKALAEEAARVAAEEAARRAAEAAAAAAAADRAREASERSSMFDADDDAGFNPSDPRAVERRVFFATLGGRGRDLTVDDKVDDDDDDSGGNDASAESRPSTATRPGTAGGGTLALERAWDLAWEDLPALFRGFGLDLDASQASKVAEVEFGPAPVALPSYWSQGPASAAASDGGEFGGHPQRPIAVGLADARALVEVARVAAVFFRVDADGSGAIDAEEIGLALKQLKMAMTPAKCRELLAVIDTDSDGTVSLSEFVEFFRHVSFDTRLKAEAEQAAAVEGFEVRLDLRRPLGMVVNPNGQVATVKAGGQGEALGIVSGCIFFECGGSPVSSLDQIKIQLEFAKKRMKLGGADTLPLRYKDPKAIARANYRVAACRKDATAAAGAAAAAASDKANARRAATQAANEALAQAHREAKARADDEARGRRAAAAAARKASQDAVAEAKRAHSAQVQAEKEASVAAARAKAEAEAEAAMRLEARRVLEAGRRAAEEDAAKAVHRLVREKEALLLAEEGFRLASGTTPRYAQDHPDALEAYLAAAKAANPGHSRPGGKGGGRAATPGTPGKRPGSREAGASFVRQRYVVSATEGGSKDLDLFTLAFGLVSMFDGRFAGPDAAQASHKAAAAQAKKRGRPKAAVPSLATELRIMTCELRCLRAWASAMRKRRKPGQPDLFQTLRGVLMDRFQRGDVASWFRALLARNQPRPTCRTEHEDGSYLVCDPRLGWIVRLETKAAPCGCDGCMDNSRAFPEGSCHFTLPDVTEDI